MFLLYAILGKLIIIQINITKVFTPNKFNKIKYYLMIVFNGHGDR